MMKPLQVVHLPLTGLPLTHTRTGIATGSISGAPATSNSNLDTDGSTDSDGIRADGNADRLTVRLWERLQRRKRQARTNISRRIRNRSHTTSHSTSNRTTRGYAPYRHGWGLPLRMPSSTGTGTATAIVPAVFTSTPSRAANLSGSRARYQLSRPRGNCTLAFSGTVDVLNSISLGLVQYQPPVASIPDCATAASPTVSMHASTFGVVFDQERHELLNAVEWFSPGAPGYDDADFADFALSHLGTAPITISMRNDLLLLSGSMNRLSMLHTGLQQHINEQQQRQQQQRQQRRRRQQQPHHQWAAAQSNRSRPDLRDNSSGTDSYTHNRPHIPALAPLLHLRIHEAPYLSSMYGNDTAPMPTASMRKWGSEELLMMMNEYDRHDSYAAQYVRFYSPHSSHSDSKGGFETADVIAAQLERLGAAVRSSWRQYRRDSGSSADIDNEEIHRRSHNGSGGTISGSVSGSDESAEFERLAAGVAEAWRKHRAHTDSPIREFDDDFERLAAAVQESWRKHRAHRMQAVVRTADTLIGDISIDAESQRLAKAVRKSWRKHRRVASGGNISSGGTPSNTNSASGSATPIRRSLQQVTELYKSTRGANFEPVASMPLNQTQMWHDWRALKSLSLNRSSSVRPALAHGTAPLATKTDSMAAREVDLTGIGWVDFESFSRAFGEAV